MRLIFMGTPAFSVPTLNALVNEGHDIVACYTQPPRPGGRRGMEPVKSPVHLAALKAGIEVRTPASFKSADEQQRFADLGADAAVVVAYGLLLPAAILSAPRLGCYNGHASLLPRWRGAAPIQRAIMAGDKQTGMMIMKMDEGLDTGPIALTEEIAIALDMTAAELHDKLAESGARLMAQAMGDLEAGTLKLTPQTEEGVEYAAKIDKQEARIDWSNSAMELHNKVRGLSPFPGAWCEMLINDRWERVKILRTKVGTGEGEPATLLDGTLTIACGKGALDLLEVQKAGSKAMSADTFMRGGKVMAVR